MSCLCGQHMVSTWSAHGQHMARARLDSTSCCVFSTWSAQDSTACPACVRSPPRIWSGGHNNHTVRLSDYAEGHIGEWIYGRLYYDSRIFRGHRKRRVACGGTWVQRVHEPQPRACSVHSHVCVAVVCRDGDANRGCLPWRRGAFAAIRTRRVGQKSLAWLCRLTGTRR